MFKRVEQWIKNKREALAFKYAPRIANAQMWVSTFEARQKLSGLTPLRVLIDSPIRSHAITHESTWVSTGTKFWGGMHPIDTGYVARIPVHAPNNQTQDYEDICYLGSLIGLARSSNLEFFTSAELMAEQERQPPRRFRTTGYSDYSILDMVKIESLDGWNFDDIMPSSLMLSGRRRNSADIQRERIANKQDELHKSILKIFGSEKHSQDAWHIRTAQVHGCSHFLTMDRSLCRMFKQHQKKLSQIGMNIVVQTPTELGRELGILKIHPHHFSYNNASFPVRSDLHLPDQKRFPSIRKNGKEVE